MLLELPHTNGCMVCGRSNPHGLRLSLHVEDQTGIVRVEFRPRIEHIGFEGIVHGGVVGTVIDEAMVWAATWAGKRFCVCGEMTVRFRDSARIDSMLIVEAKVETVRSRLILTRCTVRDGDNLIAEASGKYVPVSGERHRDVIATLVAEPATQHSAMLLREAM